MQEGCGGLNDTDVVVLLLHYISKSTTEGSVKLWIKFGVGEKGRYTPIYWQRNLERICYQLL